MNCQTQYSTVEAIRLFETALPIDPSELKTVLHLNAGRKFGGIERMCMAFAKWQGSGSIVRHHLGVCFNGLFWERLNQIDAQCHRLGGASFWNPFSVLSSRMRLSKILGKLSPDIVVCHGDWIYRLFSHAISREKIKLVRMLHSIPIGPSNYSEMSAEKLKPDLLIANSEITKSCYLRHFPGSKIKVVNPPCPAGDPSTKDTLRKRTRLSMGVDSNRNIILSAARFEESKGHNILIRALASLPPKLDWECWIAGCPNGLREKKYIAEIKNDCLNLGIRQKVKWLGHVDDMDALYASADVYCQPNTGPESFGMTFVEAQNMGCPVVTTAIGGALETVFKNDFNRLLPEANPKIVAEALTVVLTSQNRK